MELKKLRAVLRKLISISQILLSRLAYADIVLTGECFDDENHSVSRFAPDTCTPTPAASEADIHSRMG